MKYYLTVCGTTYHIIRLLGHGKGGYSYLAECDGRQVVLKQIHHEPCDYYTFGNKIDAECRDYQRLKDAGIRIPAMLAVDMGSERIVKEYIEGDTVFDLVREGVSVELYLPQVREMAEQVKAHGLNIDYFPTNFVVRDGLIWYVDYECNGYDLLFRISCCLKSTMQSTHLMAIAGSMRRSVSIPGLPFRTSMHTGSVRPQALRASQSITAIRRPETRSRSIRTSCSPD